MECTFEYECGDDYHVPRLDIHSSHGFREYRIYTSDTPNSVVIPKDDYPYLNEKVKPRVVITRCIALSFVERLPRSSKTLDPIVLHSDILVHLIPYCPATWYAVSKKTQKIAEQSITQSKHIRNQWKNGAIINKAIYEDVPEITRLFFRNRFGLSHELIGILLRDSMSYALLPIIQNIIQIAITYVTDLSDSEKIELMKVYPDIVIDKFDMKDVRVGDQDTFDILAQISRWDLIDKVYVLNELSQERQIRSRFNKYIRSGIGNAHEFKQILRDLDINSLGIVLQECYSQLVNMKSTGVTSHLDRIFDLLHDEPYIEPAMYNFLGMVVELNYSRGVEILLQRDDIRQYAIHVLLGDRIIFRIGNANEEVRNLLKKYCLSITDYSWCEYNIWQSYSYEHDDLISHMLDSGYRIGILDGSAYRIVRLYRGSIFHEIKVKDRVISLTPQHIRDQIDAEMTIAYHPQ